MELAIRNVLRTLSSAGMLQDETTEGPTHHLSAKISKPKWVVWNIAILNFLKTPANRVAQMVKELGRVAPLLQIAVALLAGSSVAYALMHNDRGTEKPSVISWVLIIVYLICQMVAHEVAHCIAAYRFGAHVRDLGVRISFGVFIVPYVRIASWMIPGRRARAQIALAGPFSDFAFAGLSAALANLDGLSGLTFSAVLKIQLGLLIVNLIPFPQTDGFRAVEALAGGQNTWIRSRRAFANFVMRKTAPEWGLTGAKSPRLAFLFLCGLLYPAAVIFLGGPQVLRWLGILI